MQTILPVNHKRVSVSEPKKRFSAGLSWARFSIQAFKDLRSFLFMTASLSFFRIILITLFITKKDPSSGLADILYVMGNGFRFDSRVAMWFVLPVFSLSVASGFFSIDRFTHRARLVLAICFTVLTLLLCGATIPYFKEYNDQFNSWIFGLIYDDFGAIIKTTWSQVPIIRGLMVLLLLITGIIFFLKKFLNREPGWAGQANHLPVWMKSIITVFILCVVGFAGRGSTGGRPVQLKDAGITRDSFLNKTVLNPYEAIRYSYSDYCESSRATGIKKFLPDGDIRTAVKLFFKDSQDFNNIDDYMRHTASGAQPVLPKHIFVIVMEGYDSWPMLEAYASMQTCPQLKAIAEKGLWVKRFLPAFIGTPHALTTIIAGLPDMKMRTNYQPSALKPYPTSIAPIFKKLGYKTRFFYSGYLSWQICRGSGLKISAAIRDSKRFTGPRIWGIGSMPMNGEWMTRPCFSLFLRPFRMISRVSRWS
jgi:phosphoglycerol transferase MdoB-like AlkP superfamily enzyme